MACRTVTIGTTATLVCAENYGRKAVVITPPSNAETYWSFTGDSAVTTVTGSTIPAAALSFSYDEGDGSCHKAIYAISASGTAVCKVEEIFN